MTGAIHPRTGVGLKAGDVLVVLHDFNARTADELTLRKSERVELMEMDDGFGDGWYLGRHLTRGGTGLFPGVYTAKATNTVRSAYSSNYTRGSQNAGSLNHQAVTVSNEVPVKALPTPPESQTRPDDDIGRAVSHSYSSSRDSTRTSVPPPSYTSYAPAVQRSIGEALSANDRNGSNEDSPVMNETLSVIDEHITDLSTPRQSLAPPTYTINEDSESEYSRDLDRHSHVAGPETDDEESETLTEAKVRSWDHKKTASYLRSIGVDQSHCDIFEEQEISGDVLLDMDQSFIHMKEYNFGVMGRRLKTWHKIREVQDEVKTGHKLGRQGTFSSNDRNSLADDASFSSSRIGSTNLPRMPSLMDKQGLNVRHRQGSGSIHDEATPAPLQPGASRTSRGAATPPSPWRASMISDTASRPSAALVRELTHSRRHSSIDVNKPSDLAQGSYSSGPSPALHQKQESMDRGWTMSGSMSTRSTPRVPEEAISHAQDLATSPAEITPIDVENDRGYFSGNDVENRRKTSMLRKRDPDAGVGHSRRLSNSAAALKRHARLSSIDSLKENPPSGNSSAAKAYHSSGYKGRLRSASARSFATRSLPGGTTPPTVTNLEKEGMLSNPRNSSGSTSNTLASMQSKAKKLMGMRAASENLSQTDRATTASRQDTSIDGSTKISPEATPTGSTTPSQASHSLEYDNADSIRKVAEVGYAPLPRAAARARAKAKQDTSAYTRGLLKITPEEARKTCDYHGWMKKKSSSLMTTWKPRLFILRGRRLSYYYSENDTEERGIIDISGHKVLVANNDAMVTLHAQLTGATSPASNPSSTEPSPRVSSGGMVSAIPFIHKKAQPETQKQDPGSSAETTPTTAPGSPSTSGNPFYFKLVPPKTGFSRAVQFTKPAVHYFQVDTITEGRKWMGELMKATIMHDWATLESTNKQKTISLAKAQARGERPKALLGDENEPTPPEDKKETVDEEKEQDTGGLNIQGLQYEPVEKVDPVIGEKHESKTDSGVGQAADIMTTEAETKAEPEAEALAPAVTDAKPETAVETPTTA